MESFAVPRAPEGAAIAAPNLKDSSWRTLWLFEVGAIIILTALLLFTVRSNVSRLALVAVALIGLWMLHYVYAANLPPMDPQSMAQPSRKLSRLITGGALIGLLSLGWFFALGRRSSSKRYPPEPFPPGNQGLADEEPGTDSDHQVKAAAFDEPYYGNVWGGPERQPLPIYKQTVDSILRGLFPLGRRLFLQAAKRTVRSRADLRLLGPGPKGLSTTVAPDGDLPHGHLEDRCGAGEHRVHGILREGSEGRIHPGRYSTGESKPWGRELSLACAGREIYRKADAGAQPPEAPAHFFTQEDLGATFTNSFTTRSSRTLRPSLHGTAAKTFSS